MADYLPPVVVRLVAETAEAVAGLERIITLAAETGAAMERAGVQMDAAMNGAVAETRALNTALTGTAAKATESANAIAAANERIAASYTAGGAAATREAAEVEAADTRMTAGGDRLVAMNERSAASWTAVGAGATRAAGEVAAAETRMTAGGDRIVAMNERTAASYTATARAAEAGAAKTTAASTEAAAATGRVGTAAERNAGLVGAANARIGTSFGGVTAGAAAAGAGVQRGFGLMAVGAAGVGYETAKMATTFDAKMELMVTMAHKPQAEIDAAKQKVLELGAATGQGPDKLAEGMYHLVSTGVSVDAALDQTGASAKLATMGMSDLDTATYAVAGIMSAAPKDIHSATEAVAMMAATVGQGDMTMQRLTDSIKSGLLPTMISAGMGFRDYGATLATMTDNSMPAEMAANRLRTAIMLMAAPTIEGTKALKDMGLEHDSLAKDMQAGGMQQAISDLATHIHNLKPAAGDAVMSFQQIADASKKYHDEMIADGATEEQATESTKHYGEALKATGTAGERAFNDIEKAMGGSKSAGTIMTLVDETGKLDQKYRDMGTTAQEAKTFNDHWNDSLQQTNVKAMMAKAGLQAFGIQIGENLLPMVNRALDVVIKFGGALTSGSTAARLVADVITGVLVVAIAAYTAKMLVAIATTSAWLLRMPAQFVAAAAQQVASWGLMGKGAQTYVQEQRAAAAASDATMADMVAVQKKGISEMVAAIKTGMSEMVASIRGGGAEEVASTRVTETEKTAAVKVGTAERTAATRVGSAEQVAITRATGAEQVAAQKVSGAEQAAVAETSAVAAGTRAKGGWLRSVGNSIGGTALFLFMVKMMDDATGGHVQAELGKLVADANNQLKNIGSPDTMAVPTSHIGQFFATINAWQHRSIDDWRAGIGQQRQYTADGYGEISRAAMDKIKTLPPDMQREMLATQGNLRAGLTAMAGVAGPTTQTTVDAVSRALGHLPPTAAQAGQQTSDQLRQQLGLMPPPAAQAAGTTQAGVRQQLGLMPPAANTSGQQTVAGLQRGLAPMPANAEQVAKDTWNRMDAATKAGVAQAAVDAGKLPPQVTANLGPLPPDVAARGKATWDGMTQATRDGVARSAQQAGTLPPLTVAAVDPMTAVLAAQGQQNWGAYVDATRKGVADIVAAAQQLPPQLDAALAPVKPDLERISNDSWRAFLDSTNRGIDEVENRVRRMPDEIVHEFDALPGQLQNVGRAAMAGFDQGISSMEGPILDHAHRIAEEVHQQMADALQVKSPSEVMHNLGVDVLRGLLNGLRAYEPQIIAFLNQLAARFNITWGHHPGGPGGFAAPTLTTYGAGTSGGAPVTYVTIQGSILDSQGMYRALQQVALRTGQRNVTTGLGIK